MLAPVKNIAQTLDNPFFRDRGGVQEMPHPERPGFKLIANPIRLGEPLPNRRGSQLGGNTDDILTELSYLDWEIDSLRDAAVV